MSQPLTYSPQIGFTSLLQEQKRFFFAALRVRAKAKTTLSPLLGPPSDACVLRLFFFFWAAPILLYWTALLCHSSITYGFHIFSQI